MQRQLQKSQAPSEVTAKLPWDVGRKKGVSSVLLWFHVLPGPQQRLAEAWGSCPLGLPCYPLWISSSSSRQLTRSWCPLGRQGQLVCYREICGAHPSRRGRGKAALTSL